tara:strand:+ start:135 stop:800 length:666 start_codon:yes stop_codon:yes gene_type:complete
LPKKISEIEKRKILKGFIKGISIDELSENFNCSKITISRHLKKNISENEYKDIIKRNNLKKNEDEIVTTKNNISNSYDLEKTIEDHINPEKSLTDPSFSEQPFIEIAPLNCDIDNTPQKDISSIPICDVDFPKIVYLVVDKQIELQTKILREYPEWDFLSKEELNRITIEIYDDLKVAKRFCNKEQKVIKVPNSNVFKIAAPFLLNKGISRIVSSDKLISL